MIVLEPGFKVVRKTWPQYANKQKNEIEELLKKEMPNVEIKHFDEEKFKYMSEEFYFEAIALVTNEKGIVVCVKFFGQEPDFEKIANPIGKNYNSVSSEISSLMTNVAIVVVDEAGNALLWRNNDGKQSHVLVTISAEDGNVCEPLKYARVAFVA